MNGLIISSVSLTTWILLKYRIDNSAMLIFQDCTQCLFSPLFCDAIYNAKIMQHPMRYEWILNLEHLKEIDLGYLNDFNMICQRLRKFAEQLVFE
jgi:hypothetical protein